MRSNSTQFSSTAPARPAPAARPRRPRPAALHAGQRLHQPRVQRQAALGRQRGGQGREFGLVQTLGIEHRLLRQAMMVQPGPAQMHAVQQDGRATAPRQPGQFDQRLDGRVVAGTDVFHASAPKALMGAKLRRCSAQAMLAQQPQVQRRAVTLCADRRHIADIARAGAAGPRRGRSWPGWTRPRSPAPGRLPDHGLHRAAQLGAWLPSTSASCGATDRPCTARCIANMVARRMFRLSISWTLALAMNQASARSRISSASASRRAGLSALNRPGPRSAGPDRESRRRHRPLRPVGPGRPRPRRR